MLTKNELANTMQLLTVTMHLIIDDYETLDNDSKVEISKLVNSLSGSVPAIACELLTGVFLSKKARQVMFDTNTDVTNGHASEWFVKSIQCKSVTNKVCVHPQKQLCEALDQVNGDTGHMPGPTTPEVLTLCLTTKITSGHFLGALERVC